MMTAGQSTGGGPFDAWHKWIAQREIEWCRKKLWSQGAVIVVAVSGGPDSMLLLHALTALDERSDCKPGKLIVAHVHHGFRGQESDEEAEFVEQETVKLGLPFEMIRVDAPGLSKREGLNPQAAARQLRYEFLIQIAHRYAATHIALAHHADDQAETVLMRMIRGTGITGLAGMAWSREEDGLHYIRPLLDLRKAEVLQRCDERGIPYVTDSSNAKRSYFRNRMRLDIIPQLEEENPKLVEAMCRMADALRDEDDYMEYETRKLFQRHVKAVNGDKSVDSNSAPFIPHVQTGYILDRNTFLGLHVALQRRLIKLILNYLTRGSDQIDFEAVDSARVRAAGECSTTWRVDVAQDIVFAREYGRLLWLRIHHEHKEGADCKASFTIHRTDAMGQLFLPDNNSTLRWLTSEELKGCGNSGSMEEISVGQHHHGQAWEASFDADGLCWPLVVRTRQPGDRMRIQGLNGSKKVQDMFVDLKIAPSLRDTIPLVADANGHVVWIPGVRRSNAAYVQSSTQAVIHFALEGGAHERSVHP
ncbi:tRNA lysidine(34) synthetase TilS [Paenibacillus sp. B1-33]|uniref:tRNA lysidine(34) synthetase TilS n=1 Tax=unclassified Paenibacillus TaxID=185978 RepID=UPI003D2AAB86